MRPTTGAVIGNEQHEQGWWAPPGSRRKSGTWCSPSAAFSRGRPRNPGQTWVTAPSPSQRSLSGRCRYARLMVFLWLLFKGMAEMLAELRCGQFAWRVCSLLLLPALMVLSVAAMPAFASTYVVYIPLDSPIYDELDTLNSFGYLDSYLDEIKPIAGSRRLVSPSKRNELLRIASCRHPGAQPDPRFARSAEPGSPMARGQPRGQRAHLAAAGGADRSAVHLLARRPAFLELTNFRNLADRRAGRYAAASQQRRHPDRAGKQ